MLVSDNSPVRKNYFDSNILNENARILQFVQMDYFEVVIARSQMVTSDVIKVQNIHVKRH